MAMQYIDSEPLIADIVARDRDDHQVLLVAVKSGVTAEQTIKRVIDSFLAYSNKSRQFIPFLMFVDHKNIQIFDSVSTNLFKLTVVLETSTILSKYDPKFDKKRIFEPYLIVLTEAWLRDFAYHWKLKNPPAFEQLESIGLVKKLEGGSTQTEVELENHSLC